MRLSLKFLAIGLYATALGCDDVPAPFSQEGTIVERREGRMEVSTLRARSDACSWVYELPLDLIVVRADQTAGDASSLVVGARVLVFGEPYTHQTGMCPHGAVAKEVRLR